jgi:hypothetical protein
MKAHIEIEKYLEAIKAFQERFPTAHVGGSIGLFLHGVDLKRSLGQSDIDMTIDETPKIDLQIAAYEESSEGSDFDGNFRINMVDNKYIKMEIRVNPEPSFDVINYKGIDYNVSKKRDIIFWKTKYAKNGHPKHIDDLIVINGGERPEPKSKPIEANEVWDDLPF